jgi:HAMP domain-containing protein
VRKIKSSVSVLIGKCSPVPLQAVLSVMLFAVVLMVGGVLTVLNYQRGREMANNASAVLFAHIQREMALQIDGLYRPISQLVDLTVRQPLASAETLEQRLLHLPALAEAMQHNKALSALYVGYANGDFFLVRKLDRSVSNILKASVPPGAAFLVQSVSDATAAAGRSKGTFIFLAADLKVLETVARPDYRFDPRQRDWYREAIAAPAQVQTRPYVFFSTREPGFTIARRSAARNSVVGADISLSDLSAMLRQQNISPSAELALTDGQSLVLAYHKPELLSKPRADDGRLRLAALSELGGRPFAVLTAKLRERVINTPFETDIDGRRWFGRIKPVPLGATPSYLAIALPEDELLADAGRMLDNGLTVTLVLLLAAAPLAWFVAWRLGIPLRRLVQQAQSMQNFDFRQPARVQSRIREIDILTGSMNETRSTIRRFTDVSVALAAEQNLDRLLERVVSESMSFAHADAGILYLLDDERRMATAHRPASRRCRRRSISVCPAMPPTRCARPCSQAVR